jgi:hypothetical protein
MFSLLSALQCPWIGSETDQVVSAAMLFSDDGLSSLCNIHQSCLDQKLFVVHVELRILITVIMWASCLTSFHVFYQCFTK